MNYDRSNTFMTQKGYCHLLPDRIVLTEDGHYNRPLVQQRQKRKVIYETLISLAFIAFMIYMVIRIYPEDHFWSVTLTILTGMMCIRLVASWFYSQTAVIPRSSIRNVRFIKAFPYLMRSRLIVTFEDANGKQQKRFIPLPGWLNEGDRHTAEAIALLEKEELLPFPAISH